MIYVRLQPDDVRLGHVQGPTAGTGMPGSCRAYRLEDGVLRWTVTMRQPSVRTNWGCQLVRVVFGNLRSHEGDDTLPPLRVLGQVQVDLSELPIHCRPAPERNLPASWRRTSCTCWRSQGASRRLALLGTTHRSSTPRLAGQC